MKPLDLSGKSALVTGGNRGIGAATVTALAAAGATVTYTARSASSLAQGPAGDRITGVVADATDRAATVAARSVASATTPVIPVPVGPWARLEAERAV